ncbi:D-amino acid aminotransferase [sulfur-oxidizing endosymbiont of Gigantopelta aegis]|uniref:D-amino acid aminotransferase n=1 Tax=sulfur-oxidizing endosymbiont of Gigantopelta aegis TaxID=2794934 RepID=UPI0018DB75D7|nr:D-amino acid aminotransferase [sulfur-oxidizing endosymbiont of Gigantopelta aegis]
MHTPDAEPIAYINGQFIALKDARVSVLDRGFIFGDGIYEVIPVYARQPFRLSHHLQRLENNLREIQIKNPLSSSQWQALIEQLIEKNNYHNQSVYLQITRGVAARDHRFPKQNKPTVFLMTSALEKQAPEIAQQGVAAITLPDNRWLNCHIKSISLLPNVLLRQQALDNNAQEAILIKGGHATEGAASNIFIVQDNCLITPPKSPLLLPGVTRDLVVELAQANDICCQEQAITEAELFNAKEVWLSSSTKKILPVTKLNDKIVGNGLPGSYWQQMITIYQGYIATLNTNTENKQ